MKDEFSLPHWNPKNDLSRPGDDEMMKPRSDGLVQRKGRSRHGKRRSTARRSSLLAPVADKSLELGDLSFLYDLNDFYDDEWKSWPPLEHTRKYPWKELFDKQERDLIPPSDEPAETEGEREAGRKD